ncbi:hypothetical protein IDJ77_15090 [Mucilaginibacter sp. ZT4R22]|uniref:DUF3375 family protein n=1 Tax=Mucilaginibacter pankratovii TaxID=2772110 RepID=A0ABR7WS62_9SPHI|nr:hypothetical protein [Mucilaginibacter pankratovii]MBD1365140.1 hypothetical protein [Mucilaginibacter pankratovii]
MDKPDNNNFDFLSEISKGYTYHLLFPDPKAGLAIVWLYQRIESGVFLDKTFTEGDIHDALQAVNQTTTAVNARYSWEVYNRVIADLQEYFLYYDESRQVYKLKEYANEFCRHAYNTLKASFDPTIIEKICFSLRERLESYKEKGDLTDWFDIHFKTFQPVLRQQIDHLDRQIDHSVIEMRQNLNLKNRNITEILKKIDARFDLIRKQNNELRAGFSEMDLIRRVLEAFAVQNEQERIGDLIFDAILFFQEMKQTLSLVDSRLDRIQPKVRQLFTNLNKPLFNSRIEGFLGNLILHSQITVAKGSKKILELPAGIPRTELHGPPMNFIIFERKKDLFPLKAKKRFIAEEDEAAKAIAFSGFKEKLVQQDVISGWIDQISKDLREAGSVRFSDYFFAIVRQGSEAELTLAVGLTFRVMRFFEQHNLYQLTIQSHLATKPDNQISLWEMTIQKR